MPTASPKRCMSATRSCDAPAAIAPAEALTAIRLAVFLWMMSK